ncbi:hypothetical protein IAQ61_008749 [Plenodomus lingam]|uniref:Similar to covalently-linked cell wall protein n=1 Tax=Leptosphaeria maculans (strain JN3 / isolate v23.1.3 / race Av1-4-5-6-7-8) TaxID=985895 RepID=E4ZNG2_LEPMJ|nr:similar to covalently-linked cell wall protein [Plenodomus lingam JN3]KAH9864804.1 hypothetical protein IAQ61_008749 [Plenodomus lingam]CBX93021.1 similar to covalently-linked cell wall protein [Plenodomus lingam JN3]
MKSFAAISLVAAAVALPQTSSPEGCASSAPGSFQVSPVKVTSSTKRSIEARQLAGTLTLTLNDGELKDQAGRIGYIASNYQFQFDNPVQAGARETSGFSLCGNQSLALGGSTVFYQCLSGTFYNLYSQSTGEQCNQIHMQAVNAPGGGASQIPDGQPQATSAGPAVSQISDGQPQASSAGPAISQISDGQPQAPTGVVSQISDGQPQGPTATPVVSQISDGQPQAPTGVVSQISDGQVQAPTAVVSQISDGQPQAPIATGNVTSPTMPAMPEFTGAASTSFASFSALAAGFLGLFAML